MADWIQAAVAIAAICGAIATAYVALVARNLYAAMRSMRELLEQQLTTQRAEIEALRRWRHDFGQKEMVYDDLVDRHNALEERVRGIETSVAVHLGKGVQ